eukprot:g19424.t1
MSRKSNTQKTLCMTFRKKMTWKWHRNQAIEQKTQKASASAFRTPSTSASPTPSTSASQTPSSASRDFDLCYNVRAMLNDPCFSQAGVYGTIAVAHSRHDQPVPYWSPKKQADHDDYVRLSLDKVSNLSSRLRCGDRNQTCFKGGTGQKKKTRNVVSWTTEATHWRGEDKSRDSSVSLEALFPWVYGSWHVVKAVGGTLVQLPGCGGACRPSCSMCPLPLRTWAILLPSWTPVLSKFAKISKVADVPKPMCDAEDSHPVPGVPTPLSALRCRWVATVINVLRRVPMSSHIA